VDTLADFYLACVHQPTTSAAVRASPGLDLPTQVSMSLLEEFQRTGLMFVGEQFVLRLPCPPSPGGEPSGATAVSPS